MSTRGSSKIMFMFAVLQVLLPLSHLDWNDRICSFIQYCSCHFTIRCFLVGCQMLELELPEMRVFDGKTTHVILCVNKRYGDIDVIIVNIEAHKYLLTDGQQKQFSMKLVMAGDLHWQQSSPCLWHIFGWQWLPRHGLKETPGAGSAGSAGSTGAGYGTAESAGTTWHNIDRKQSIILNIQWKR